MAVAGDIVANLTANTKGWTSGLQSAITPLNVFSAAVIGAAAGGIANFAKLGDELDKMTARTGIGAEALSGLRYAAGQTDTSMESLEKAFVKQAKFMEELSSGGKGATDTLRKLGLSAHDLDGKTGDQQLLIFADALHGIDDVGRRSAIAMDVFGKGAVDLLPLMSNGAKGITELTDEAKTLGLIMTTEDATAAAQFGDSLDRLTNAGNMLLVNVVKPLVPLLTDAANWMAFTAGANGDWVEVLAKTSVVIVGVVGAIKAVSLATQAYTKAQAIASALGGPAGWLKLAAGAAIAAGTVYALNTQFDSINGSSATLQGNLNADTSAAGKFNSAMQGLTSTTDALTVGTDRYYKHTFQTREGVKEFTSTLNGFTDAQRTEIQSLLDRNQAGEASARILDLEREAAKRLADSTAEASAETAALTATTNAYADSATRQYKHQFLTANGYVEVATSIKDLTAEQRYALEAELRLNDAGVKNSVIRAMEAEANAKLAEEIQVRRDASTSAAAAAEADAAATRNAAAAQAQLRKAYEAGVEIHRKQNDLILSLLPASQQFLIETNQQTQAWLDAYNAGSRIGMKYEDLLTLQAKLGEQKTGYTDQFQNVTDALRVLRGEITETELKFEQMSQFGVSTEQIDKLRDATSQLKEGTEKKDRIQGTKDRISASLETPLSKFLAEAKAVEEAIQSGDLNQQIGVDYLEKERQKMLDEQQAAADAEQPQRKAVLTEAVSVRSSVGQQQLVELLNRKGGSGLGPDQLKKKQEKERTEYAKRTAIAIEQMAANGPAKLETKPFKGQTG